MHLEAFVADAVTTSIDEQPAFRHSGVRTQSANPEPMNTGFRRHPQNSVFMGSGLAPLGRPGMTLVDFTVS